MFDTFTKKCTRNYTTAYAISFKTEKEIRCAVRMYSALGRLWCDLRYKVALMLIKKDVQTFNDDILKRYEAPVPK